MIIEHRLKARDIRRTHRSLFLLQGLCVFITLGDTISVHDVRLSPFSVQIQTLYNHAQIQLFNIVYNLLFNACMICIHRTAHFMMSFPWN